MPDMDCSGLRNKYGVGKNTLWNVGMAAIVPPLAMLAFSESHLHERRFKDTMFIMGLQVNAIIAGP